MTSTDPDVEALADLFMDLRLDGPAADGWTYQETARHYARIILRRWLAGIRRDPTDPLTRIERHELLVPPHPQDVYRTSALCSCGDWQFDYESPSMLPYRDILREHTAHRALLDAERARAARIEKAAREAKNALALTVTNVPEDGSRPHWCRYVGRHDATCSGMLATQDALRAALGEPSDDR